ncbi:MAG: folylpolyglutamate synthase/dihydrofolate synthase family protein [Bacteroidota bacterium]
MTYAETLDWLFHQLPMFQRQGGTALKKDLTNIRLLLAALDHPERKLQVVHIGGTNGKGSTAHLIAAALQATGVRVGVYTSPHYQDFRERIKINAQLVPEQFVIDFTGAIREKAANIQPSFFELTVAMAFAYFAQEKVDWVVIEVGLGGRLDSTNVVDPILSVITNISKDHTQFLGDTLPLIAGEKAGIIKPEKPVVIGETHPETVAVFTAKAQSTNSKIIFADQEWQVKSLAETNQHSYFEVLRKGEIFLENMAANLHGPFQYKNLQTALASLWELDQLGAYKLDLAELAASWSSLSSLTYYIGRWQLLGHAPDIIVDSAHNEGGLQIVTERLAQQVTGQLHIVLGVVNDKDLANILPLFPTTAIYYFVKADIPRGLPAEELAQKAATVGLKGHTYPSVQAGYQAALSAASDADTVFVGGSIFTVAEVL